MSQNSSSNWNYACTPAPASKDEVVEEGARIMERMFEAFWDRDQQRFRRSKKTEPHYTGDGTYVVWPLAVAAQAVVDAARVKPEQFKHMIEPVFKMFEKYYIPKYKAYAAWLYFENNSDIYYDDNAQIASAFITAYEVTGECWLLEKGKENVEFLMTGWDETGHPGGVKWHVSKDYYNSCTTAESALAAMRLARNVQDNAAYVSFAKKCAEWLVTKCQDSEDKLIWDGIGKDGKINKMKWTYNQGTTLSLLCILYKLTYDKKYLHQASGLVEKVVDRTQWLFTRDLTNIEFRYYRDSVVFYQLLAEGFADFIHHLSGHAEPHLLSKVVEECKHELLFVHEFLRDTKDGMYFSTFLPWEIDPQTTEKWNKLSGDTRQFSCKESEREEIDAPCVNRPLIKAVISVAGAARTFFQSARIVHSLA